MYKATKRRFPYDNGERMIRFPFDNGEGDIVYSCPVQAGEIRHERRLSPKQARGEQLQPEREGNDV
jgi:hypothetical protein